MKKNFPLILTMLIINAVCYGQEDSLFRQFAPHWGRIPRMDSIKWDVGSLSISVQDSVGDYVKWDMNGRMTITGDTIKLIKYIITEWSRCRKELQKITPNTFINVAYKYQDSLTAEKFFDDSLGNHYMCEYRYSPTRQFPLEDTGSMKSHYHCIAIVSIIKFHGNKQQTIISNIKAIYSPTECSSDNKELWLKRLYQYQK